MEFKNKQNEVLEMESIITKNSTKLKIKLFNITEMILVNWTMINKIEAKKKIEKINETTS